MALYYIPGASFPDGTPADYIDSSEGFVLNEIQYPRYYLDRSELDGTTRCTFEVCPFDGTEYLITEHRNGPVIGWVGTPRSPDEVLVLKRANARAAALAEIDRLERSITDRMWREDAVGSTALMEIKKQDENGDWVVDTDDPRTGKTATQYIAYVNSAIANIRAGL
ncbi:protein of unknown function [Magnetospirillum sp. XM-1]|uniref:hypothetical protein n=1 Tax=Magnetospirillum sp. XM-1 TaxID=1663591 RepID=UPI00073DFEAD|nr:hypothetical protein [Magnetospirillum sp. XM-1]CUW40259.1 protein of unknown function [Magnetospirillum sp. XM-1]